MDLKTVLSEVQVWPAEQRLQLLEKLWEGLYEPETAADAGDALKRLLDSRLDALEQNPSNVISWETVEARAAERFGG